MTPLRILLVGDYPDDPRLGSSKVAHKLREEFRAAGHECDALFAGDIGARPVGRQLRQLVAPIMANAAIAAAHHRRAYDVVDAASAEGLWFGARRAARQFRRTAFICRSHGLEHLNYARMLDDSAAGITSKPWTRRIWYPVSRLSQVAAAARLADRLILLNHRDKAYAISRGWQPENCIDVIPHGVSDVFLAAGAPQPRGAGALFCGSWDHMKGIRYLVDAFTALARNGGAVPLTVLGAGVPAAQVLASFPETVRPRVTVIDKVSEDRVLAEFRRHDVLIAPSTYEGFGLVIIEAMSQGLPVIATPYGAAALVVRDGITGRIVPPRDAGAIASAVESLMRNADQRARLGANAAKAVSEMSWRSTAQRTVESYRRALDTIRS